MPFSSSLIVYINNHPEFRISLKLYNLTRFKVLHTIFLSYPPSLPTEDEVVGIYYCDVNNVKKNKYPYFKQDFVVNHNNQSFTSYTAIKSQSKDVKHITEFFTNIGQGKYYGTANGKGDHHYNDVNDLHPDLKEEAKLILQSITVH